MTPKIKAEIRKEEIPLAVRAVDPLPLDEKYRVRGGYSDWERAFGVDWNSQDERVG